jgi:hypothetical protein
VRLSSFALFAVVSISSPPAFGDLVQITSVDGSVRGSGTAIAANDFGPTFDSHSFSFTGTNT